MAEVNLKYFVCECCEDTFDRADDLSKVSVSCRQYNREGDKFIRSFKEMSFCVNCRNALWDICDREFATVEVGYQTKVFKHFTESNKSEEGIKVCYL